MVVWNRMRDKCLRLERKKISTFHAYFIALSINLLYLSP